MSNTDVPSKFTVAVLPLGEVSSSQTSFTAAVLRRRFGVNTIILPSAEAPLEYFDAESKKYHGGKILDFLFAKLPDDAQRILGIIDGALEDSEKEACFGLAYPYHRTALYSTLNIKERSEGDNLAFSYNLITHEFGHTLGLNHCNRPDCIMNNEQCSFALCELCKKWADRELKVVLGSAEDRFSLAESFFRFDCFSRAISLYREAIACTPNEPLYHHRLAMALNLMDKDEKDEEFQLALQLSNDNNYCYVLAVLALNANRLDDAKQDFERVIAVAKDLKLTQKIIGQAYREITHDVELASQHYQEYLRLGGDDQDVIDWLISRNKPLVRERTFSTIFPVE